VETGKLTLRGGVAQVDVCPDRAGFILSLERLSVWLSLSEAVDVVQTLARALELEAGRAAATEPPTGEAGAQEGAATVLPLRKG
jgi:hypothetical protein